jgi:rRNA maturation endonuclease Nob1
MAFMNRFKHGINVTKFKADQMMRINKIQGEINEIRQQISGAHMEIANTAFGLYKQGHLADADIKRLCIAVEGLMSQIAEHEAMIEAIRAEEAPRQPVEDWGVPQNPCPYCRFDLPEGAVFCPNCGHSLPETSSMEMPSVQAAASACPNCQAQLPPGVSFCPNCGHPIQRVEGIREQEEGK